MKKIQILLLTISLALLTGCSDKGLKEIQNGTLNLCEDYTIKELTDNYLENPEWSKTRSDKGYFLYNVKGNAYYDNNLSEFLIQFAITDDEIVLKDFEIDKTDSNTYSYIQLINDMCKTTKIKKDGISKQIKNVEVRKIYNSEKYSIDESKIPRNVELTLYGLQEQLDKILNEDLYVTLPLHNYGVGEKQKVYFEFDISDEVISKINPEYVEVDISYKKSSTPKPPVIDKNTNNDTVNYENLIQKEITKEVEYKNLDSRYKIEFLSSKEISIIVRGPKDDVNSVLADDIHAYIDLNYQGIGKYYEQIIISGSNENLAYTSKPHSIEIKITS